MHSGHIILRRTCVLGAAFASLLAGPFASSAMGQELPKGVPAQGGGTDQAGIGAGQDVTHAAPKVSPRAVRAGQPTAGTSADFAEFAEFVDKAHKAGKTEVQASQLAAQRSRHPSVKRFAQQMVTDHSKVNEALRQLAAKKGVSVPNDAAVDPDIEALKGKTGREFDIAYLDIAGPDAHEKAVTLFRTEAEKGQDPDLRAFAQKTLPTLRHHLSEAREVSAKVEMGK